MGDPRASDPFNKSMVEIDTRKRNGVGITAIPGQGDEDFSQIS